MTVLPVLTAEADPVAARTRVTWLTENLVGQAGDTLTDPIVIRVTDSDGMALGDLPVGWSTPDGGSIVSLGARTDSLGEARARWTLGPRAGGQRIQVQVGNARTMPLFTARATGESGPAASIIVRAGDGQAGTVGGALAKPVIVRASDRLGNPVSGAWISILPKTGTVFDSTARTDSAGQLRVRWTLGSTAGVQHMILRLGGAAADVDVTARARAQVAAKLAFLSSHTVGTGMLAIGVTDSYGNPVAGLKVRFRASGGTVASANMVTDAKGQAQTRWTPAKKSKKRSVTAEVPGTEVRATLTLP